MNISPDIDARAAAVLAFWFERGIVDPSGARRSLDVWFATNTWYDEALRERFADDVVAAHARDYEHWRAHAESALALLLLTDQIPRNIYRRKPQAFRADAYAQEIARTAIADDLHLGVPFFARLFFFMPFEHAEDLELQDTCVAGYR